MNVYLMPGENSVPGMYAGHVVVEWTDGGVMFQVSAHGGARKRALALAMAVGIMKDLSEPNPPDTC